MSFELKAGVSTAGVRPEILSALSVAQSVYADAGFPFVVTSLNDGLHMPGSFHYQGLAADLRLARVNGVPAPVAVQRSLRDRIAAALGSDYDVILESDHIHIEFDRRTTLPSALPSGGGASAATPGAWGFLEPDASGASWRDSGPLAGYSDTELAIGGLAVLAAWAALR